MTQNLKFQMKHLFTASAHVKLNEISLFTVTATSKRQSNLRQFSTMCAVAVSVTLSMS